MSTEIVAVQRELINTGRSKNDLAICRFTNRALLTHLQGCALKKDPKQQWCSVKELASKFHNRSTERTRALMRKSLTKTFRKFLDWGYFLAIEYASSTDNGKKQAVKLYQGEQGLARQHAIEQIKRMRKMKEITEKTFGDASQLLLSFEPTTGLEPSTPAHPVSE